MDYYRWGTGMTIITHKGKVRNGSQPSLFISKWDTTQEGSANDTVVLPLVSDGDYDFYVDWGDGNRDNITTYNQSEVTHQYSNTGIYEIRIKGEISGWQFNNAGDDDKITEISKWGPLRFIPNDTYLFYDCSNLEVTATDSLTIEGDNFYYMFRDCPNIGSAGDMSNWDTSNATRMDYFATFASNFNQKLDNWDTSNITNARTAFFGASAFNNGGSTGINNWNMGNVTDMRDMFYDCSVFNQPLGNWDMGSANNISRMFYSALVFNQDLSNWNITGVTTLRETFHNTDDFNNGGSPGISGWDTSNVTDMYNTFGNTDSFNQPIGSWDTSSVTSIRYMFQNADSFDQDLSNWTVTGVTNASDFMVGASGLSTTNYDLTLSGWAQQSGDLQAGVSIHFGGSQYSTATGAGYRQTLIDAGWTITDGGQV